LFRNRAEVVPARQSAVALGRRWAAGEGAGLSGTPGVPEDPPAKEVSTAGPLPVTNETPAAKVSAVKKAPEVKFVGKQKARGFAPKTINNRLAVLSRLLRYAHENGVTPPPATPLRFRSPGSHPRPSRCRSMMWSGS
jgi:hypothetical protein